MAARSLAAMASHSGVDGIRPRYSSCRWSAANAAFAPCRCNGSGIASASPYLPRRAASPAGHKPATRTKRHGRLSLHFGSKRLPAAMISHASPRSRSCMAPCSALKRRLSLTMSSSERRIASASHSCLRAKPRTCSRTASKRARSRFPLDHSVTKHRPFAGRRGGAAGTVSTAAAARPFAGDQPATRLMIRLSPTRG